MFLSNRDLYDQIISLQDANGELCDPELYSPLNSQYHYSSLLFANLCFNDINAFEKTLYHFKNHVWGNIISVEFDTFFLVLIKKYFTKVFQEYNLEEYIKFLTDVDLQKKNNNFYVLQLASKVLGQYKTEATEELAKIRSFTGDDGIFFDTGVANDGVPHIAYHLKILSLLVLINNEVNNQNLSLIISKALYSTNKLIISNEFCYFGRSQNSLFALGNLQLLAKLFPNYKFNDVVKNNLASIDLKNSLYKINLSSNGARNGYDGYMFDIVYNSYFCAISCLGNLVKESNIKETITVLSTFKFIKLKSDESFVINSNSTQHNPNYLHDSRSPIHVPLIWVKENISLLPPTGFYPRKILTHVEKPQHFKNIKTKIYKFINFKWLPLYSGNSIIIDDTKQKFYLYRSTIKDKSSYELEFRTRKVLPTKNILTKYISMHSNYSESYEQSYSLPEKLTIYYSIRDKSSNFSIHHNKLVTDYFEYTFSSTPSLIKHMEVGSSREKCYITVLKFKRISEFKIVQKSL